MTIHLALPLSQNPPPTAEPESDPVDELPVISVYTDDDAIEDGIKTELPYTPVADRLFDLGRVLVTTGAEALLDRIGQDKETLLRRHQSGDWGELSNDDRRANDDALRHGGRLFSAYRIQAEKVWVITEADRRSTTVLLPDEY
jgi:hypothetical protein